MVWSISRSCSSRGRTLPLALLAIGLGACGNGVTAPNPSHDATCELSAALEASAADPQPFGFDALREAFVHAAGPMASALGSSTEVEQLKGSMSRLGAHDERMSWDTSCRLLVAAAGSLAALKDDPATLPDREAIRLVLVLAAGVVRAGQP